MVFVNFDPSSVTAQATTKVFNRISFSVNAILLVCANKEIQFLKVKKTYCIHSGSLKMKSFQLQLRRPYFGPSRLTKKIYYHVRQFNFNS